MLTSNVWCSAARSWSCSCRSSIRSIWDRAIRTVVTLVHWTCWWYRRWVIRWALWAQCKSVQRWTQYFNRTKALCFRIKGSCHFAISIIIIGWVVLLFRVENLFLGSNDDDEIVSEREREREIFYSRTKSACACISYWPWPLPFHQYGMKLRRDQPIRTIQRASFL